MALFRRALILPAKVPAAAALVSYPPRLEASVLLFWESRAGSCID